MRWQFRDAQEIEAKLQMLQETVESSEETSWVG